MLERHEFDRGNVLWLTNIVAYPWLSKWGAWDVTIYRAADEHSAFAESPLSLRAVEEEVVRSVDLIFAASHGVYDRLRPIRPNAVHYLPNGVDLDRFQPKQPPPAEYSAYARPIAVYVGAINYWFDRGLLEEVARKQANVTFVLIGEARVSLGTISTLPNVHVLGPRAPRRVPAYLQHADVGLIPFVESALTHNVNPLKMYEYLACGLPVVSTDLSEVRMMRAPVHLATGAAAFCRALEAALSIDDGQREEYLAYAAQHTWQARYDRLDRTLAKALR
jgi:glycosyltransferase involved in cell wall biosynthesis